MSVTPRSAGKSVGIALVVIGVLVLLIKALGSALFALAFRLFWPAVLIWIGWRMYRKGNRSNAGKGTPAADA